MKLNSIFPAMALIFGLLIPSSSFRAAPDDIVIPTDSGTYSDRNGVKFENDSALVGSLTSYQNENQNFYTLSTEYGRPESIFAIHSYGDGSAIIDFTLDDGTDVAVNKFFADGIDLNYNKEPHYTKIWGDSNTTPAIYVDGAQNATTISGDFRAVSGANGIGPAATQVISNGNLAYTNAHISVDTEGGAATDNLDCITGGQEGDRLYLHSENSTRDTTIRFGVCNIIGKGTSFTLTARADLVVLFNNGISWVVETAMDNN